VIVAGANFGSGSSREGAVYALYDAGFRALFAPSFGEIFASNCLKNGILTAKLDQPTIDAIQSLLLSSDDASVIVDINSETLTLPSGESISLTLDPFQKHCLINGLNEIDLSLEFHDAISAFEAAYRQQYPWISS
jgi:3-isopropylmalate/(R)-2-methylmalate dehydratase small subunit